MLIDKDYVANIKGELDRKIEVWKEQFPKLKFDEWGRALLAPLTGITEEECVNLRFASKSFEAAFNEYLGVKEYLIRDKFSNYMTMFESYDSNLYDYVENYYHFRKKDGKLVRVKASKVLAAVQDIWVKNNSFYSDITKEIKSLRKDGATYESSARLRELSNMKEDEEDGNLYVIYQAIMNQNNGSGTGLYLSINPLDLLTSSGNYADNPTNFQSCWSTKIFIGEDKLTIDRGGCYSTPKDIIALGRIFNRGILYIPNGRIVNVPGTEFSLLGYRERTHCWFDTNPHGIWLEKVYPNHYERALDKYEEALKEKSIDVIDMNFYSEYEIREFDYQDYTRLSNFDEEYRSLFLDKVAISDGKLYYLPDFRTEYDYDGNIIGILSEYSYSCADCGDLCNDTHYIRGHGYICDNCEEDYTECGECGELTHNDDSYMAYDSDGSTIDICESCRDSHYYYCVECDELHHYDRCTNTENGQVCQDCLEEYYSSCSVCGDIHHGDYMYETVEGLICEDCQDRYYHTCSDCGCITRYVVEVRGDNYCECCEPADCAM